MPSGKPHKDENPHDAKHLAVLGEARARGDVAGERQAIANLIGGWLGKAESWLVFKGVDAEHRDEIIGLWSCRLVKVLKENHEFPHAFGAIAMKRIVWAHADYFRQPHRDREQSSGNPVTEHDGREELEDDTILDHLVVEKALDGLSKRDREIIEVTFFTDLSATEAGERLDLSEGALRTAKSRALGRLRSEFGQLGVTNPDDVAVRRA